MRYRFVAAAVAVAACFAVACRAPDAAAPSHGRSLGTAWQRSNDASKSSGVLVGCTKRAAFSDSGEFGPNGGTLWIGSNRLIIPPGALSDRVTISGTIVDDTVAFIQFQPEGLRFKKPAGLVLDATDCNIPDDSVADVVYIDERGNIAERIQAQYSNAWHTVAAPIEHFSGYAIAF